jgi:hypothetical protein
LPVHTELQLLVHVAVLAELSDFVGLEVHGFLERNFEGDSNWGGFLDFFTEPKLPTPSSGRGLTFRIYTERHEPNPKKRGTKF